MDYIERDILLYVTKGTIIISIVIAVELIFTHIIRVKLLLIFN